MNSYINQKKFAKEIGAGGADVKLPILFSALFSAII
jgi:hypothetical protein